MTDLSHMTAREIAVAALVGRRWTVKRIAVELAISDKRVYVLLASVARKIAVPEGEDDQQCVGEWWRAQQIIHPESGAA